MKKSIIIVLLLVSTFSFAQEKKWSLQECVNYALENNISIKQAQLTNETNEQNIISSKGQFLPSFSASASQGLSLGSSTDFLTGNRVSQTSHSTNAGLNMSQTIFNGFANTYLYRQSKLNSEASEQELNRIKDDISLNVVNAYLNILFNKENLSVAVAQYDFSKKQLDQVKQLVDAGVQPRGNLLDIEASMSTDEQNVIIAENNLALAKLSLAQLLQIPSQTLDVKPIDVGLPSELLLYNNSSSIYSYAVQNRSEIKSAEKNIEVAQLGTEISKSGYLPTLSGGYGFNTSAYFTNITNDDSFFSQLDNLKGHSFNLSLSIPIFSRFQNKTNVAKSKIQEESALLNLEQAKLTLESDIERAFTDAKAALKAYGAAQKSLDAQKLAFNNANERYSIGVMNSFDLEQVRNRLVSAEASLINAKYDFVFKTKVLDFYAGKSLID